MEFADINKLLEVYRKRLLGAEDDRRIVLETIFQICGVELKESDLVIKNGTVTVRTDMATKNEIFMLKAKILAALKGRVVHSITDIR